MNLSDVQLQQVTGFPIVKGQLSIGSKTDRTAYGVRKHDRLLLSARQELSYEMTWSQGMTIWPVNDVARDEHGFCQATLGEFGLAFHSFKLFDKGNLPRPGGCQSFLRGTRVGNLMKRERLGTGWIEKPHTPIHSYELNAEYGSEGLHIAVSGQLETFEGERGGEFSIDATIPWETLALKGFQSAAASWKFGRPLPSKSDSADRPHDPQKLADLLISGSGRPYLNGQISFTPETTYYPTRSQSAENFLSIEFIGFDEISFGGQLSVMVLDDGFAGGSAFNRFLTIATLGRSKLERELQQRDTLAMQMAGEALGSARYLTGYSREPGDRFTWIHQQIRTLSLRLALGKNGLEIAADGELDDFDPAEFAAHREERNSQLKPLRRYTLRARMPWALLIAREFSFADRVKNF